MKIFCFFLLLSLPFGVLAQTSYNSLGNPKANGLEISVVVPYGYVAKDGVRPHIVQKFVNEITNRNVTRTCLILVKNLEREVTKIDVEEIVKDYREILKSMGTPIEPISKVTMETLPAAMGDVYLTENRFGVPIEMKMRVISTAFRRNFIQLQCSVGVIKNTGFDLSMEFNKAQPEFLTFFNSVVIQNIYK